jgi:hypothetical protein
MLALLDHYLAVINGKAQSLSRRWPGCSCFGGGGIVLLVFVFCSSAFPTLRSFFQNYFSSSPFLPGGAATHPHALRHQHLRRQSYELSALDASLDGGSGGGGSRFPVLGQREMDALFARSGHSPSRGSLGSGSIDDDGSLSTAAAVAATTEEVGGCFGMQS